jgi:GntR family transcriptional regulator
MRSEDGSSRRVPAYVDVLRALRQEALGLPPGSPLSSERALAARFGVGRMTVREALRVLKQQGVVYVERGGGAFVARSRVEVPGHPERAHVEGDGGSRPPALDGRITAVRVLRFDRIGADAVAADALQLTAGTPVFRIERLLLDEDVVAHERSFIAVETCPALFRYNLEQVPVRDVLVKEGIAIVAAAEEVRAAAAGRAFAAFVRGRASDPVLIIRRTSFASEDRPIEWSVTTYRADRYRATYRVPLAPA